MPYGHKGKINTRMCLAEWRWAPRFKRLPTAVEGIVLNRLGRGLIGDAWQPAHCAASGLWAPTPGSFRQDKLFRFQCWRAGASARKKLTGTAGDRSRGVERAVGWLNPSYSTAMLPRMRQWRYFACLALLNLDLFRSAFMFIRDVWGT